MKKAGWLGAAMLGTAAGILAMAAPASAHVTVNPNEATQGERARVDFRVPNESDTASTTELEVHFPEETPISSVSVGKVPGWSAEVAYRTLDTPMEGGHGEQITEVVDVITWTADDEEVAIGPGEFVEFPVSLGPLPEVEQLSFPSLQTYSDGEVVRWIELPADGAEPEHPAPTLTLAAADQSAEVTGEGSDEGSATDTAQESDSAGSESSTGTWLGLAGLLAGLAGAALGGLAFARTRRG